MYTSWKEGFGMNSFKDNRLWVKAYNWIKNAIDDGYLKVGEPLSENRLSKEIGVSRTPVREALRALTQEGYVDIVPGRGAFVSELSLEDAKEIYDIRRLLEPFAALSAIQRIPDDEIEALEKAWRDLQTRVNSGDPVPWSEVVAVDESFHNTLIGYSTNKKVKQILISYRVQIKRFQLLSARSLANLQDTVLQHLKLIECLKKRDGEALSRELSEHIVKSEQNVLRDYFVK
jgi:DNA-binding GntR family transcriptional regulator